MSLVTNGQTAWTWDVLLRRNDLQLGKVLAIAAGVPGQQRHASHRGVSAYEEVRKRGRARPALLAVSLENLGRQKGRIPGNRRPGEVARRKRDFNILYARETNGHLRVDNGIYCQKSI